MGDESSSIVMCLLYAPLLKGQVLLLNILILIIYYNCSIYVC